MSDVKACRLVRCGLALFLCLVVYSPAQSIVTTVAGAYVGDGKPATSAALQNPLYAAMDQAGNLYIADNFAHRIRKVGAGGISTVAGTGFGGFSGDGGPASAARIKFPAGVTIDVNQNVIFSDSGNNRIRKISSDGTISTIAGTGQAGFSGDGGPATSARLNDPYGLAADTAGNLYIADQGNQRIRKIDAAGIIHTVAGTGVAGFGGDGGPAISALVNSPHGVGVDTSGNLYIADTENFRVRKVDSAGVITTIAGSGGAGCTGDGGPAIQASMGKVRAVVIHAGQLVISNAGCDFIRSVDLATNIITTIAGSFTTTGFGGFDGNGHSALASVFFIPYGVLYDRSGNLLIVDSGNAQVRRVDSSTQIVNAAAGGAIGDGRLGTSAALNFPENMHADSAGNLYITDFSHRIRKLSPSGIVTTYAGTGVSGVSGDGGPATEADLLFPLAVVPDSAGNVFIADEFGLMIRKVDASGTISTFGPPGQFFFITDLAVDTSGNLYAADAGTCVIWKINPTGTATVIAGIQFECGYNSDGIPATQAMLNSPYGVTFDASGNLYIADADNNRVRKIDSQGIITTIAGKGSCGFSGDGGAATSAKLCFPAAVTLDAAGNLLIGDYENFRFRKVDTAGIISTFAGTGKTGYNGNNASPTKTNIDGPSSIVALPNGIIYYSDDVQQRIRKIH